MTSDNQKTLLTEAISARLHLFEQSHTYEEQPPTSGHPVQFWGFYTITVRETGQHITRDGEYRYNKQDAQESAAEQMRLYVECTSIHGSTQDFLLTSLVASELLSLH
jgi:hypothetical protein